MGIQSTFFMLALFGKKNFNSVVAIKRKDNIYLA